MSSEEGEDQYVRVGKRLVNARTGETTVDTSKNLLFGADHDHTIDGRPRDKFVSGTRRYLDDLRMPPKDSRSYAIVLSYTLFGLSDADIGFILNVPTERIDELRHTKEYNHLMDCILQNIREHDKDKVRKILNKNAEKAAQTIVDISNDKLHKKQFDAAKHVLDMTGHNRNSEVDAGKSVGITIRYIDDREKNVAVEIDDGVV